MNLIFDFDGVVADSEEAFNASLFLAFKRAGFSYGKREIASHTKLQYFETISLLATNKRVLIIKYFVEELIGYIRKGDFLFPYAKKALTMLSKKHQLFVVSNSYQRFLDECANVYYLQFEEMVGRSRRFLKKETGLNYLLEKYRMNKNDTAYVGDSCGDITLARSVGIQAYAVYSGWASKEKLEKCKPDKIFENILEMSRLI